jgi:arginase/agmatinase
VIFGIPFDGTSSYRKGSSLAPNAVRQAYVNLESYDLYHGIDFTQVKICDLGDLFESEDVKEVVDSVRQIVTLIRSDGKVPIMMGGEHSITVGSIGCFKESTMIIIDAHSDFRDEYMGNPLNHACVTRRSLEILGSDRIFSVGTRSVSRDEFESEEFRKVRFFYSDEVSEKGIQWVIDEIEQRAGPSIYFSIDMDGIDPAFAPGVGTPEPFGLPDRDVRALLRHFAPRIEGFDILEFTPVHDNGNTSMLAAKLIQEFIGSRELSRHKAHSNR